MNIWLKSILAGLLMAAIVFFISGKINQSIAGMKYIIQYKLMAEPVAGSSRPVSMPLIIKILSKRFQAAGYEYDIKKSGSNVLLINLSGVTDTILSRKIITTDNRVQFREVYTVDKLSGLLLAADSITRKMFPVTEKNKRPGAPNENITPEVKELLHNIDSIGEADNSAQTGLLSLIKIQASYTDASGKLVYPGYIGKVHLKDTGLVSKIFHSKEVVQAGPADLQFYYGAADNYAGRTHEPSFMLYGIRTFGRPEKALLENDDIIDATPELGTDGKPQVTFQFNAGGAKKWEALTRLNTGKTIAIIVNDYVVSAPSIESPLSGARVVISGNFSISECADLAAQLRGSSLPAALTITVSKIKIENNLSSLKNLWITLISFLIFSGLAFFLFYMLKPIPAVPFANHNKAL